VAPATTEKFLASCDAANSITTIESRPGETGSLEERIWRLLKPYERPDEKALIPHKPTKQELERTASVIKKSSGIPSSKSPMRSGCRNERRRVCHGSA
jgi:hypothetical protein